MTPVSCFCKEILVKDKGNQGDQNATLSEFEGKVLEWLCPRVEPFLDKDPSHPGKLEAFREDREFSLPRQHAPRFIRNDARLRRAWIFRQRIPSVDRRRANPLSEFGLGGPVRLEFVVRPPLGAGPSPGSGRPNGHCSARHGPPCVRRRRSTACGPSTTRGCVPRCPGFLFPSLHPSFCIGFQRTQCIVLE